VGGEVKESGPAAVGEEGVVEKVDSPPAGEESANLL
jgi:hypothetical protein